ncbi:hypothetical protein C2G38_2278553 [Gigaspora rosea]|uniref:Ubiquitin-like domain-containing protein n=1 Tax=Gigaspora rosea TaxID=44941 RepID=A0A397VUQ5_9GLOM|nr:hypothetical protein C2G38_2278553 [Gigaspora rosea]CAG8629071.1 15927_t:CDS:1 [Gigaspora rosea]
MSLTKTSVNSVNYVRRYCGYIHINASNCTKVIVKESKWTASFDIRDYDTIINLKNDIEDKYNINADEQVIVYKDKILEDNQTFEYLRKNLGFRPDEDTFHLIRRAKVPRDDPKKIHNELYTKAFQTYQTSQEPIPKDGLIKVILPNRVLEIPTSGRDTINSLERAIFESANIDMSRKTEKYSCSDYGVSLKLVFKNKVINDRKLDPNFSLSSTLQSLGICPRRPSSNHNGNSIVFCTLNFHGG